MFTENFIGFNTESKDHPDLAQALFSKISWSNDPDLAIPWHPHWQRGSWAGSRIDLTLLSDIEDLDEWKDISEPTFRDLWKACLIDGTIKNECNCNLCQIYRRMCIEEKEKRGQQGEKEEKTEMMRLKYPILRSPRRESNGNPSKESG
jgi:hypothetical protein